LTGNRLAGAPADAVWSDAAFVTVVRLPVGVARDGVAAAIATAGRA
jgi:hypothetical protein